MNALAPIDVSDLDVVSDPCNLRRDLHVFASYVQEREVKRLHRSNGLSKADSLRLAKLMSDSEALAEVREHGESAWVAYVDRLALKLGFVSYDTKGTYAGYTSSEPSYPDNYIQFKATAYRRFLASPLADQERALLKALVDERDGCASEFFRTGILGRLDGFSSFGCATGVVPSLDFPQARRFLLDLLSGCQVGVWYSAAALIQHLKTAHPYFLIPREPKSDARRGGRTGRYGNFREGADHWNPNLDISERAADAFERVEGRYVERFLEGAPLTLGYVDVAYSPQPHKGLYPSINTLQAFRVRGRLSLALRGDVPAPQVTVQPNFEIYVESAFYPAQVLSQLTPLADVVSEGALTVLRLRKELAAAHLAQDDRLDPVALLARLSGRELPANVARELTEWAAHSEKFVLYQGFALLEGDEELLASDPLVAAKTVRRLSPTLHLIHSPADLFDHLQGAELMPLRVQHPASALGSLPPQAHTLFAQTAPPARSQPKPPEKTPVLLRRHTTITLHFPGDEPLERFRQAALEVRCPVEVDRPNHAVTFSQRHESQVMQILKTLEGDYLIRIEDIA